MAHGNSKTVDSNQSGPHDKLTDIVLRHLQHASRKPFNQHTVEAFEHTCEWLGQWQGPLIMDSCCGVGESTALIAAQNPQARVIGIDKSALRTGKHRENYRGDSENYLIVRADLNDFWRLAHQKEWRLDQHYLLYPNPYPKSAHIQRRWHGSAAFADLLRLGGRLQVRSNWNIYIEEFAMALNIAGVPSRTEEYSSTSPMTPFERKYWDSGQSSWQVSADLSLYMPTQISSSPEAGDTGCE